MTHSTDLRERVLSYLEKGHTLIQASETFSVSASSIKRWRRKIRETGTLLPKSREKSPYKIDTFSLKKHIKSNPDAYLHEIASHFGVTESGIHRALKRMNYTRKKSLPSI